MRKDWGSIHILPTRESEAGYDPDSMHTKCSTCDVVCQKIFQGTEKHQGYQWMSCFTLPSKGVCLCRNLWKRVMQAERYKHHFLQLATFFTLMRRLFFYLLLYQTESCVLNFVWSEGEEWRHLCLGIWWKWLTGQCEGKWKWSSCLASWCVDPWLKCAFLTPLVTLS